MPAEHKLTSGEIGMIRIYMKPADKSPHGPRSLWLRKPLYRELVMQAKKDGIMNAVAHHTHYGFSNHGPVMNDGTELANPYLTMCVELIGERHELERFCEIHGVLLSDKVIAYKQLEHWRLGP
jgi:PII-like signaling protein